MKKTHLVSLRDRGPNDVIEFTARRDAQLKYFFFKHIWLLIYVKQKDES